MRPSREANAGRDQPFDWLRAERTSEWFWLNLQGQDLDIEYDRVGDRIEREVTPRAVSAIAR